MRIHFIAIGGTIMHSLAIELKKNGHIITGSDNIIYNPSKSNLMRENLLPKKEGWFVENITFDLDVVILGMHAKQNNPELLAAKKKNIKILSFPEFIANYSLDKRRIVISGSHGKTTITAMIIHVLNFNNIEVDYLVGAKTDQLDNQVKLNNNNNIIIEGDEYHSSAIDNRPKFMHYNPNILVVSGVEWDHINVFPSISSYERAFELLLNNVLKKSGKIFYCHNDNFLSKFLVSKSENVKSYDLPNYYVRNNKFIIQYHSQDIPLNVFGQHNLYNIEAAKHVCVELGVDEENFYKSIQDFKGAARRLTLMCNYNNHSSVYYDFAHSPSKVRATVNAVKELHPNRYLIACLELHTFSSLSLNFIPNYCNVFNNCNEVWIFIDKIVLVNKGIKGLDLDFLIKSFKHKNIVIIKDKFNFKQRLCELKLSNTNLLLMSSGNFGGVDIKELFK